MSKKIFIFIVFVMIILGNFIIKNDKSVLKQTDENASPAVVIYPYTNIELSDLNIKTDITIPTFSENTIPIETCYADYTQPIITLNGLNEVIIYRNQKYKEAGYQAYDSYDGDLTNLVKIESNIDTSKIGEYYIKYYVSDKSQNIAFITRKVIVKPAPIVGIPVLMYHFFYASNNNSRSLDNNWLDINKFEEQLKYLVDNEYNFITMDELLGYINGTKLPKKSIMITIDDGDDSVLELAYPIASKYNVPLNIFLITSNVDIANYSNKPLLSLYSHSHNLHRGGCKVGKGSIMYCLNKDAIMNDLSLSISSLENNIAFCYPFGDYNDTIISYIREANFKLGFTTNSGRVTKGANPYILPRVRINGDISLELFKRLVK